MVGSCEIDTDEFDDIVDWSCTANFPGVSLICLVNGVPLEDCLCEWTPIIRVPIQNLSCQVLWTWAHTDSAALCRWYICFHLVTSAVKSYILPSTLFLLLPLLHSAPTRPYTHAHTHARMHTHTNARMHAHTLVSGELNSEIGTAKYPDGEYSLELILNSQDGRSKNFTHMFRVETLTAISSSASEGIQQCCVVDSLI